MSPLSINNFNPIPPLDSNIKFSKDNQGKNISSLKLNVDEKENPNDNLLLFENRKSFDLIEDVVKNEGKNLDKIRNK